MLSKREKEVMSFLIKGSTNPEIAKELHISLNTAKAHVRHIIIKLGAKNRTEAVAIVTQKINCQHKE